MYYAKLSYFLGHQRHVYFKLNPAKLLRSSDKLIRLYISLITFSAPQPAMAHSLLSIGLTQPGPEYELVDLLEFDELPMLWPQGWGQVYLEIDYLSDDGAVDSGVCLSLESLLRMYGQFLGEFVRHTSQPLVSPSYTLADAHLGCCICRDPHDDETGSAHYEEVLNYF